jgi:hypothetical protein
MTVLLSENRSPRLARDKRSICALDPVGVKDPPPPTPDDDDDDDDDPLSPIRWGEDRCRRRDVRDKPLVITSSILS